MSDSLTARLDALESELTTLRDKEAIRDVIHRYAFRLTGEARTLTEWRNPGKKVLADALREPLLERAIGVVYRPESELSSHYFEAVMADQFDAFVWFEQTRAVTPLGHEKPHGAPETYPFGL